MSTAPIIPQRYQLGVPEASAALPTNGVVLIGSSAADKTALDGNTYTISWFAMTNYNDVDQDSEAAIAANADLAGSVWPQYRQHIDLSIDGGLTWIRRIGYGVQTPKGAVSGEFIWSPPEDYSLLTPSAVLRLVDLDGRVFRGKTNGAPYDVPTNGLISATFAIAGAVIDTPAEGTILYPDTTIPLAFRQVSDSTQFDLYWITPTTSAFMGTISNCVMGANSVSLYIPADFPVVPEIRFAIRGVETPAIIGYSGTFEVQP